MQPCLPRMILAAALATALLAASAQPAPPRVSRPAKNLLLLGWDGVQWNHLQELLAAGKLPHLAKLQAEGSFAHALVSDHATDTKSGWVQICSGLPASESGTHSNSDYRPLPPGATLFERLERRSGGAVFTCFVAGKSHHLGSLGPGVSFLKRRRLANSGEGEPWFHTRAGFDQWFGDQHREAGEVGHLLLNVLRQYGRYNRFAIFAHFADPDTMGHAHGENSPEYAEAIITCDRWLGEVAAMLQQHGLLEDTVVAVVTDHGFDEGAQQHWHAPDIFFAANRPELALSNGDMRDIAPVLLRLVAGD